MVVAQKDMQFIEQKIFNRQAIISIFGCSPEVIGISENSNRSTSGNMFNFYYKATVNPIIDDIEEDFNHQFIHPIDGNVFIKFKRHLTSETEDIIKKFHGGIITGNRASELMGEESDPNDESRNTYIVPNTVTALDQAVAVLDPSTMPTPPTTPGKCNCGDDHKADLSNPKNIDAICEDFAVKAAPGKQFQQKYLKQSLKTRAKIEDTYTFKLAGYFKAQETRCINKFMAKYGSKDMPIINTKGLDPTEAVNIMFDIGTEELLLGQELRSMYTSGVQRAIQDINTIAGSSINSQTSNPHVTAAIGRIGRMIKGQKTESVITETTRKDLESVIMSSVRDSLTIEETQKAISDKFTEFQGTRARMIARTETRAAWDAGATVGYTELGVKMLDVVGCTGGDDYPLSDCNRANVPILMAGQLSFHPKHIGCLVPAEEPV
jgi:hypothetical protein